MGRDKDTETKRDRQTEPETGIETTLSNNFSLFFLSLFFFSSFFLSSLNQTYFQCTILVFIRGTAQIRFHFHYRYDYH